MPTPRRKDIITSASCAPARCSGRALASGRRQNIASVEGFGLSSSVFLGGGGGTPFGFTHSPGGGGSGVIGCSGGGAGAVSALLPDTASLGGGGAPMSVAGGYISAGDEGEGGFSSSLAMPASPILPIREHAIRSSAVPFLPSAPRDINFMTSWEGSKAISIPRFQKSFMETSPSASA